MATSKRYTVAYRRKREGKTDYKQRFRLVKGQLPRLTVRKALKNITVQIIQYTPKGDKVLAQANTIELKKLGWKGATSNTPASYLCGMLIAKKAKDKKITQSITDIGQQTSVKGAIIYAAIKGANDNGLRVQCAETIYPDQERIKGTHIAQWAKKLKQENKEQYTKQFAQYLKKGLDPETLPKHFDDISKKIKGGA